MPNASQSASSATPVLLAVDDSPAPPPKPTRDEREYKKLLEMYLGPATAFIIILLCFLLKIPGDMEYKEAIASELAMNKDEQEMIVEPLARVLDKQHYPAHIKTAIVNSGDMIGLALGFGAYGVRVWGALQTLKGRQHEQFRGAAPEQTAPEAGNGNGNGHLGGFALASFGQYSP